MTLGIGLSIVGLVFNALASILVIVPFLTKHNIDDDYIVDSDGKPATTGRRSI
jgi:hypothetical protein